MRILFLPGFACTSQIWLPVLPYFHPACSPTLIDWPTELTPSFDRISAFSDWLASKVDLRTYHMLVGHSMGGLIAIQSLLDHAKDPARLLLVESFLFPPGPFFQNLLMPGASPDLQEQVNLMLQSEREHYAPSLAPALRQINLAQEIMAIDQTVHALYGDRGKPSQARAELNWSDQIATHVAVHLIPDACHFPMLENPPIVAEAINQITRKARQSEGQ